MGINYNPRIVTNGLVLALDAGNIKSYPGSGTNWSDLIGSGNNGTLTNGPTYSSTSGGSIVFDGGNANVSIGTNGFSFGISPGTLSAWAKTNDRYSTRTIISYGNATTNGARFLGIGASNFYFSGYGSSISASGVSTDTWFNLVGVYDGTNASMYVNGALVAGPTARSWNTVANNAGIGKNVSNSEYWSGDVAQVQIYNKALSAAEIQQNYNALKGRYVNYIPTIIPYWIATLGGANEDVGHSIAVDGSGNVYVIGKTGSSGVFNVLIAKYNSSGIIQWQRTLGGVGSDQGWGIAVDGSGNVYITGETQSSGAGGPDALIAKYDAATGTRIWQRTLGGVGSDVGYDIAVDGSGNVYVSGYTTSSGAGSADVLIAKYNTSGTIQWQRTLGGVNSDYGTGIAVDGSGNVYITGFTLSSGEANGNVLIAKYDTSGTIQWQRTLGGAGFDSGYGIAVDGSGNVYITGRTDSSNAGSYDVLIAKYDTNGGRIWQRTLGVAGQDYVYGIAVDSSGNVYITGWTAGSTYGVDLLIAKLPGDGSLTGTYGALTYATPSNTVIVAGTPSDAVIVSGTPSNTVIVAGEPSNTVIVSGEPSNTVIVSGTPSPALTSSTIVIL